MQKRKGKAGKSIHQLTAGCLPIREAAWCARLIADFAKAEIYFWSRTAERRKIQQRYLQIRGQLQRNDFFFEK